MLHCCLLPTLLWPGWQQVFEDQVAGGKREEAEADADENEGQDAEVVVTTCVPRCLAFPACGSLELLRPSWFFALKLLEFLTVAKLRRNSGEHEQ